MLKGWAEICGYARHSSRTLRRWVWTKGFPILLGRGVRPPISSKELINQWYLDEIQKQGKKKK